MYQAVDIALLPDRSCMDELIRINQHLTGCKQSVDFGDGAIPHLTLAQVLMTMDEIAVAWDAIAPCWDDVMSFHHLGVESRTNVLKGSTSSFITVQDDTIGPIHETVMDVVKSCYVDRVARDDHFLCVESLTGREKDRINDFYDQYAYANYWPHVTLGMGLLDGYHPKLPDQLSFDRLIIGRLAHSGTVREVLFEKCFSLG